MWCPFKSTKVWYNHAKRLSMGGILSIIIGKGNKEYKRVIEKKNNRRRE